MSKGSRGNRCPGKGTEGPLEHVLVIRLKLGSEEKNKKRKDEQKLEDLALLL